MQILIQKLVILQKKPLKVMKKLENLYIKHYEFEKNFLYFQYEQGQLEQSKNFKNYWDYIFHLQQEIGILECDNRSLKESARSLERRLKLMRLTIQRTNPTCSVSSNMRNQMFLKAEC